MVKKRNKPTGKLEVLRNVCDQDDKLLLARERTLLAAIEFGYVYAKSGATLEWTITAAKTAIIQKEES